MIKVNKNSELTLIIPSLLERMEKVERYIEKIAKKMNFSEGERDNLAIAVTEAVSNAITHGNKKDKKKKVIIRCRLSPDKLTVYVKDEGKGFDLNKITNPLDPKNILKETGRGIFILRSLMDEVDFKFSEDGTEVKMVKYKKILQ